MKCVYCQEGTAYICNEFIDYGDFRVREEYMKCADRGNEFVTDEQRASFEQRVKAIAAALEEEVELFTFH